MSSKFVLNYTTTMREFFKELFEYSHHCNLRFIEHFEIHKDMTSEKSVKLMSHILNAQHIWNSRIVQQVPLFATWDLQPTENFLQLENSNFQQTSVIINSVDLETVMDYKTSTGIAMKNKVKDMLFQVVNHSTYHRAQITTEWKQSGIKIIPSDYILYKR